MSKSKVAGVTFSDCDSPLLLRNFWLRFWIQLRICFKFENPALVQTSRNIYL